MACSSSCPELSEHVSYTLHKLQMTDITLRAEECSAMEAIYNRQNVFVWLPTDREEEPSLLTPTNLFLTPHDN